MDARKSLSGWGRTASSVSRVVPATSDAHLAELIRDAGPRGVLARGLGRSYGDAALNAGGVVLDLTGRETLGAIDADTGEITVDAGVSVDGLLRTCVPKGWFVPVTPGTRYVTVGGAISSDIHGKDHHVKGSFGQHVRSLDLLIGTGEIRTLGPGDDLFWATVGGMGLTGIILRATVVLSRIETAFCSVDTSRASNFDELLAAMEDDADHEYSVAWIDCLARGDSLGRSVLTRGRFAAVDELPEKKRDTALTYAPRTPFSAIRAVPSGLFNKFSVAAFNEAWFRKAPTRREGEIQSLTSFFHPLDAVADWNRIYGAGGLLQYQIVVPETAVDVIRSCVEAFSAAGVPSPLAQVKRLGPGDPAPLSFPAAGWSFSIDVPAATSGLAELLDGLDGLVVGAGGRGYLAKDSRMSPETVAAMYPRLGEWQSVRDAADPERVFRSDLARRLKL